MWSILLSLSSLIPRVLFSPAIRTNLQRQVAYAISWPPTANKVVDAIPFIGEVISVLTVVGDVATLAEEAAETIVAPWVIENEVNLNYQATVTVKHDPDDATSAGHRQQLVAEIKLNATLPRRASPAPSTPTGASSPRPGAPGHRSVWRQPPSSGAWWCWTRAVTRWGRRFGQAHQRRPEQPADQVEFAIIESRRHRRRHRLPARRHCHLQRLGRRLYLVQGVTSDGTRQSARSRR